MKKFTAVFLAFLIVISVQLVPAYAQEDQISVIVDGTAVHFDVPPVISQNRVLVPMRAIFEALGATVQWYGDTRTVIGKKGNQIITLRIGSTDATVNGQHKTLDVAATIINNRTLVPTRFVSESLGAEVSWNGSTRTVTINDSDIYSRIKDGLENLHDRIDVSAYVIGSDASGNVFAALDKVLEDNPDIFYIANEGTRYWSDGVLQVAYEYSGDKIQQMKRNLAVKRDDIISAVIKPGMSDYDKELAVHDYIVKNTRYDEANYESGTVPYDSYTAYGVLLKGVAVCEGYAKAMKLLLDYAGVECRLVTGDAVTDNSGTKQTIGHAWNIVKIDGAYYQVDSTWDDPVPDGGNAVSYNYFNLTDSQMSVNHSWDTSKYPECSSTKYNYFYKNNLVADNYQEFYNLVKNAIINKSSSILIKVNNYDENVYDITNTVNKIERQLPGLGYYITEWSGAVDSETGVIDIRHIKYTDN